ncbi:hypothetical protein BC827DRAFT_1341818 [Russula dissimulans]|nr:hypothetical protein BC827DRAFT_1341818 [Russula dissimulans]
MKWIKRTVHVLHSLSTNHIVVSGVSSAFPPAKAVFAAIGILLSAIKNIDKSYDTLVDLFESFESFLRRLDVYTKIPLTTAMTEVIVKILTELLSTISLAIQQVKQGRLKKLGKNILGENDREVEAILKRLDRLTLEEARMTGTTTLEVVYDLLKNMKMVMDDKSVLMDDVRRALGVFVSLSTLSLLIVVAVDIQQVASNMNKLRRDELQEKIRRWLSPSDPSINHNTARDVHHEGSAKWFIHGNTFQQWKMEMGSLLWVSGKPGSGKSILSFSIIEDITKSHEAGLASIAFFYFDFKDESKKNARGALSSLLVQLAAQSDSYSEILSALYSKHDAGSKQPSNDGLKKCLESMLAIPDQAPIYIVIDALDECPNSTDTPSPREKVLSLVEWLVELRRSNLWVCVTSRLEADIEGILRPLASHTVSLHGETGQNEDIINYIKWFVYSDPKARKWRKQDKELVIEKLSERAYGMYASVFRYLSILTKMAM